MFWPIPTFCGPSNRNVDQPQTNARAGGGRTGQPHRDGIQQRRQQQGQQLEIADHRHQHELIAAPRPPTPGPVPAHSSAQPATVAERSPSASKESPPAPSRPARRPSRSRSRSDPATSNAVKARMAFIAARVKSRCSGFSCPRNTLLAWRPLLDRIAQFQNLLRVAAASAPVPSAATRPASARWPASFRSVVRPGKPAHRSVVAAP